MKLTLNDMFKVYMNNNIKLEALYQSKLSLPVGLLWKEEPFR